MSETAKPSEIVPTLADVARQAGVSTATVSRCLNPPGQVQKKTRDRVMKAVEDLGYSPNFSAQSLAAKRTNTIGAIIPTMENAIFARGLQAFQEELWLAGHTLLVASSGYRPELEEEQIRMLAARGAEALLLIGHHRDPGIYRFLDQRGIPVLVSWAHDAQAPKPSIGFDNRRAMAEIAKHAIALGHRDIAVISADRAANDRARDRVAGVQDAMALAGLDSARLPVVEIPYSIENGATGFARVMARPDRPSLVICGNDVLAVGALQKAAEMGMDVPRDVSITGFDDIELATVVRPALTTVHVPHRDMGRSAARTLLSAIRDDTPIQSIALATELRLRGTLAPPRG